MSILEKALEYVDKYGFAVFPLHGVINGMCTCGNNECLSVGKHPWTKRGLRDASKDHDVVKNLFNGKQEANIGVATGVVSNIFALDIDGAIGEANIAKYPRLPETLTTTTGRGRHAIFRYPTWKNVSSSAGKIASGIDIRGDGGYIVVPPSRHYSGICYEFLDDDTDIAIAPEWLVDAAARNRENKSPVKYFEEKETVTNIQEWTIDQVRDMLACLDPDMGYDEWIQVGMSLHSGGYSLALWDEWSRRGGKYKVGCTIPHWKSFKHSGGISFGTLVRMAQLEGWKPEEEEEIPFEDHPAKEFLTRVRAGAVIKASDDTKINLSLFDPLKISGLIGDTVRDIIATSQKPQPELALMNTLAALGAIFGRRYASPMDTRTNIYFVGIALTASGKDHSRRYIKRLMLEADLDMFLGPDAIVSGPGLLTSVKLKPSNVMMIDEFGMLLESMMDARGTHYLRSASKILTEFYSTSSGIYLGGQYADEKVEQVKIPFPNLCIYATTTPEIYVNNLNRSAIASGELNRFIVLRTKVDMPARRRYDGGARPSEDIVSAWSNLYEGERLNCTSIAQTPITVSWTGLDDRIWDMGIFEDSKIIENRTSGALWGRYRENVIKIAMIFAICRNTVVPVINNNDLDIAEAVVRQAVEYTISLTENNLYESQHEKDCNFVLKVLSEHDGGLTKMELNNYTRKFTQRQRAEILDSLDSQGLIVISRDEITGRGKPASIIRLA